MLKDKLKQLLGEPKDLYQAKQVIDLLLDTVEAQQEQLDALGDRRSSNSRNSSKPPSSDSPSDRKQRTKKKNSGGRKQGGQPGHKGHHRALHPESEVDRFHHWYPGSCLCGGEVMPSGKAPLRHQIIDLPEVRPLITEHRLHHGCCCRCGTPQYAQLPDSVSGTPFGPRLHACIALLNGQFHLSDRQIREYLQMFHELRVSLGGINNMQGRITPWLWPLAQEVRDYLRKLPWVHADETTHWHKQEQRWMWVLAAPQAAYFQTHYSRGKLAADNLLGEDFQVILVSDRHGAYKTVPAERRQFCIPHVIRNFKKMEQRRGIDGHMGKKIVKSLQLLIRIDHRREQGLAESHFRRRCRKVQKQLVGHLQRSMEVCRKKSRNQCEKLLQDAGCLFTFIRHPGLPLTNNEAERAIRPYVIWRKTSFATQSARGDRFRAYILTVVETCKRQDLSALQILRDTCWQGLTGQPITTSVLAGKAVMAV